MIIGVDFDGTCVDHRFPAIGRDVPGAVQVLRDLVEQEHRLILWTMRSGVSLAEACEWFSRHAIPLFGINENPQQQEWTASPKAYCQLYIDDAALGCPLHQLAGFARPHVDWSAVRIYLNGKGILK